MSGAHFHVVFTHGVFWLVILGSLLLGIALWKKSGTLRTTGMVFLLAGSLLSIPVFLTGEAAEHTVEEYGVEHDVIHEHEEAAELLFYFLIALGALVSLVLTSRSGSTGRGPTIALLLLALAVTVMTARVAGLGGEVRHEEIRAVE